MLDRGGAAEYGAPRRLRRVRVHDAAPPQRLGLPARGRELLLREVRPAALADALRSENLDHVCAGGDPLPDGQPQGVRASVRRGDPIERCDHARSRDGAPGDGVAQLAIEVRADALHGRDPRHEGAVRVLLGVEHRLLERLLAAGIVVRATVGIEVRREMHVRVDAAGHHGQGAQIVRRRGEPGVESRDPRSSDDEGRVAHHAAPAVEDGTGANRDGGRLANREAGGGAGEREQPAKTRHGRASRTKLVYRTEASR